MQENSRKIKQPAWVVPLLWENRRLLLGICCGGLLFFVALAFIIPVKFKSTVALMPQDSSLSENTRLEAALGGMPMVGTSALGGLVSTRSPDWEFLAILQSRTEQDYLINRFHLLQVYHDKLYRDARKELTKRTTIDEDKKTGVLTVTVTDHVASRARDLADAYVEELNRLVGTLDTSSAHRERLFLEERLKAVRQDLETASQQLSQFSSHNATLDMQNQGKMILDATATLQGQLIAAESQLQGLEQIYSPDNARVLEAKARVDSLRQNLQKLGGTGQVASSNLSTGQLYPSLRELPLFGKTYADLYRQERIEETIYEVLTRQYEVAKVEEAREIPTVKVLDEPDLPEKKFFPPRTLLILLGTALSFMAGVTWIVGRQYWASVDESSSFLKAWVIAFRRLNGRHDPIATASSSNEIVMK